VGSHTVNGVAELHSELLRTQLFKDFYEMLPKKFQNKTNGVTPRRWIRCANPTLAKIYTKHLGDDDWLMDLDSIRGLKGKINNKDFIAEFQEMKLENKRRLVRWVQKECTKYIK
jgi:glycogen phosphorylase